MIGNQKTSLIVMSIALVAFLLVKVLPAFKTETKTPVSGKVKLSNSSIGDYGQGNVWFISETGETLAKVDVEIADTDYKINKGLMDRSQMKENQGMLFVFKDVEKRSFWMKNTKIPLDIIYITQEGLIDSYYQLATPYSVEPLPSSGAAQYVVEVNSGFIERYHLRKGTKFIYNRN